MVPAIYGIATCIEFVAGRWIERIKHGMGCVAAARVALAGLLSAFLERLYPIASAVTLHQGILPDPGQYFCLVVSAQYRESFGMSCHKGTLRP